MTAVFLALVVWVAFIGILGAGDWLLRRLVDDETIERIAERVFR